MLGLPKNAGEKIVEASMSRNEWEETLGESQLVIASQSIKPRTGQGQPMTMGALGGFKG